MGIKFTCPACGRPLNVKSELAGKRGRCPKCQAKIAIPLQDAPGSDTAGGAQAEPESSFVPETKTAETAVEPNPLVSTAVTSGKSLAADEQTMVLPATTLAAAGAVLDAISEAPALQWYAVPAGATNQYGPASGEEFRGWMQEGRVTADALIWRQDWADWKRAGSVFPHLGTTAPVAAMAPPVAAPAAMPLATAGATPLPTAAAMPMLPTGAPMAPAFPMPSAGPGLFPTAAPAAPQASGEFPNMAPEPATTRGSVRGRAYRPRSNTGPVVAIVVLLLAMIPLSFFVWKVVSEQLGSSPPSEAATGSKESEE